MFQLDSSYALKDSLALLLFSFINSFKKKVWLDWGLRLRFLRYGTPQPRVLGKLWNFVIHKNYLLWTYKQAPNLSYLFLFLQNFRGGWDFWDTLYTFNGFETNIQNSQFIILAKKFTDVKVIMENIYFIEGLKLGLFN